MDLPAEVAAGTKADAVDAKRAKIARIRAIILIDIVFVDYRERIDKVLQGGVMKQMGMVTFFFSISS